MARRRDYRAEYRRRNELARQQGYPNYEAKRRARAAGKPLPTDRGARRPEQRDIARGAARVAEHRWTIIRRGQPRRPDGRGRNASNTQVLAAARRTHRRKRRPGRKRDRLGSAITIRATIRRPSLNGGGNRQVTIGGRGGIDARTVIAKGGPGPERGAGGAGVRGIVTLIREQYENDEWFDGFTISWIASVGLTIR